MPDFSKPCDDGALPDGFTPWRWTLSETVQPELLLPVKSGLEYRIVVSVLRKVVSTHEPGYGGLYDRSITLANGRAARLKCADPDAALHTRIVTHGWFTHLNTNLARAFVTIGAMYPGKGDQPLQGQPLPAREDFAVPGGMTPEKYTLPAEADKRFYESYSDYDVRDPLAPETNIFTISYGQYVPSCGEADYKPLMERAEDLAQFHFSILKERGLKIVRREWFCATHPDIAVVHLYIET
jgi:hypothetical protein